jgi:putative oxidoreductase
MTDWALLVLRVGLGVMFMAHGMQKAFGAFGGPGMQGFTQFCASLGFSPAWAWAYLAAYIELLAGLLVLLGAGTRTASALLFVLIVIAGFKVHVSKGFFLQNGGFEYVFVIAAVCLALALAGPGKFCVWGKG